MIFQLYFVSVNCKCYLYNNLYIFFLYVNSYLCFFGSHLVLKQEVMETNTTSSCVHISNTKQEPKIKQQRESKMEISENLRQSLFESNIYNTATVQQQQNQNQQQQHQQQSRNNM